MRGRAFLQVQFDHDFGMHWFTMQETRSNTAALGKFTDATSGACTLQIAVCQTSIDECNRWLERFDVAEARCKVGNSDKAD